MYAMYHQFIRPTTTTTIGQLAVGHVPHVRLLLFFLLPSGFSLVRCLLMYIDDDVPAARSMQKMYDVRFIDQHICSHAECLSCTPCRRRGQHQPARPIDARATPAQMYWQAMPCHAGRAAKRSMRCDAIWSTANVPFGCTSFCHWCTKRCRQNKMSGWP